MKMSLMAWNIRQACLEIGLEYRVRKNILSASALLKGSK